MSKITCSCCFKPKANLHCALCNNDICKYCAQFIDENGFSFLRKIPADLQHTTYCPNCFDDKVAAAFNDYNETVEKSKEIYVFYKKEGKATRLLKRKEEPYKVDGCRDREEALMKMSFWAVKDECNALLDVELQNHKKIVDTYVTITWSGYAVPIFVTEDDLRKTGYQAP